MSLPVHRRRPRYKGTHPRRFHEKYKELQADPATLEQVKSHGKTPAGSHRPIMVDEVVQVLDPRPGQLAIDATLGAGGHAAVLLRHLVPGGRLIGVDVDPIELPRTAERLIGLGFDGAVVTVRTNFAALPAVLAEQGLDGVDLLLADLGCSSMQLDNPDRGFTFRENGPLDLRMNPRRGEPASVLLARMNEAALAQLLVEHADEPHAGAIARELAEHKGQLKTTEELASAVRAAIPRTEPDQLRATLQRVFQALRIAVNDEMRVLDHFLRNLPEVLRPGGRAAILTFHSGEDRRVKQAFAAGLSAGTLSAVSRTPLRPSPEESRSNPRARSAKLRWCHRR